MSIVGIDVSHNNGLIDWHAAADSISFAFAKATQGTTFVDPLFRFNWQSLKELGIPRGAYHFFDPGKDATAQAQHFLDTVQITPGDLPPVLDLETLRGAATQAVVIGARTWLTTVARATGRTPIIYTSASFWTQLGNPSRPGDNPLWVAHYGVRAPRLPRVWNNWTFWQFSEEGRCAGIQGHVDLNRFDGSLEDLPCAQPVQLPKAA